MLHFKLALFLAFGLLSTSMATTRAAITQEVQELIEQEQTKSHVSLINELLDTYVRYGQFNGSVLVAENGKPIVRKGFGLANMEWEIPNGPDTKFRIGSVTKQFTAALILLLVEDGKIKLAEPITTYLPDYRKETGDKVTVHHLLCHTSGIPSYTTGEFFEKHSRDSYELDEFIERFASGDLQFEPGSKYTYNNSGYHLLGAIIEKVSGQSYADFLSERILKPAGMSNSGFDVSRTILKNRAQGYERTPDGYVNADFLDMGIPYSAGSMYSTVDDLFKWDRALRADKILKPETKKLMHTPNLRDYGYGVDVSLHKIGETGGTTRLISHGGGVNGFNCLLTRVVDQNHAIVILDNVSMGEFHGDMTDSIIAILNDQPYETPKKSLVMELTPVANEQTGADVVAKYRSLKNDHATTYDFDNEEALNELGYYLLSREKVNDAIEVFKLNVEMFPDAFNPYDSLGEAYLKNDQTDLALTNYKKSVELNPENVGGQLAIKKLEGATVKADPETLKAYVGSYELQPGFVVTFTLEDGVLMGKPTGQEKVALEQVSTDEFFVSSVKANVKFQRDDEGTVTGLILEQGENKMPGKKTG